MEWDQRDKGRGEVLSETYILQGFYVNLFVGRDRVLENEGAVIVEDVVIRWRRKDGK